MNLITGLIIGLVVGGLLGWFIAQGGNTQVRNITSGNQIQTGVSDRATVFKMDMRKLWEDHITWTRLYIIESVADSGGADKAVERLLKNQEDLGNAIKPYYGNEAGGKLTALLKEHIIIAADIVKAAKAEDQASQQSTEEKWSKNADDIATFLSAANPNWSKDALKNMLDEHLKLTKDEVMARFTKDYDADIAAYDKIHEQVLLMADTLSEGIIKQFPDKFK